MPVVPMPSPKTKGGKRSVADMRSPPAEPFALMAAATMHSEGKLIPSTELPPESK